MIEKKFNPEAKQFSIVLVGDFNPAMFSPQWFGKNNIMPAEEVGFALSEQNSPIISSAITVFQTNQLNIKIDTKRFQVSATKEPLVTIKDFILKTFEGLSNYTIKAYGYNYSAHYQIENFHEFHRIGDLLAPKIYWEKLLGDDIAGDEREGGLATIQMQKQKKQKNGNISIILQSSTMFKPGFYMACNDHNVLSEDEANAENLLEKINIEFEESFNFMKDLQISVLNEVYNG